MKLLEQVLNSELEPLGKTVQSYDLIDFGIINTSEAVIMTKLMGTVATLSYVSGTEIKAKPAGEFIPSLNSSWEVNAPTVLTLIREKPHRNPFLLPSGTVLQEQGPNPLPSLSTD